MKFTKVLSAFMSVLMVFTVFAILATVATVVAPVVANAATATEKAIFIGSADSIAGAFIPMDITTDGTNNPTGTHYYKLSFKCKMLKNGSSSYQAGLPSIGIMSTYTSTAERTTTCPSWAGDYDSNTAATLANGVYSMRFYVNYDKCARRDDASDAGYRTFYITVGNAAHRADSWASYRNFGCSFIFSGVELYECNSDGSNVQTTNLIPQINSDNIDFNGTYYERTDGANQWDSPFGSAAMKWHVLDRNDVVKAITVPTNYNTSSNYNSGNFTKTAETDYTREYYTNSNYSDLIFAKLKSSNDAGFEVIPADINKKMFIIDANHEGEEDNTTVDGYVPTKNKPANIYIPLSLGQYFVENVHGLISTNNKVIVKVTFKAVRLEGDSAPCLGRIVGSKSGTSGKGSRAWGLATRNVRPSAYYSNYNRSDNGGGVRPQCTYDASTGEFVGYVGMETFNNDLASRWGVNEVLTIGNAERVYQEGTFDSTSFNSSFAISNIKVDLYSTNQNGNTYTLKDLIAEDIAPALYADTVDDTSNWAFQFTGGVSNHAHDPIRGNQYKWAVEGCTGMVHAKNLTNCMKNGHSLTHYAATENTREYYHCNTCGSNFADAFGGTVINDLTATKMMAVLPAAGSGSESIFTNVRLSGFTGNQWFKFTCKVKCLGDNVPVVSTLYSVYNGSNAYETTQPSDNDGDMAVWESSYDSATYTLTGYIKAWMPTNWNKGSRYPYLRYNPVSGACISIVIGNGRYIGDGYTDANMNTRFAITEPELYKINGATTGGEAGLTDAKSKSVTGSNLIAPITDKTIDFDSTYAMVRTHVANPLSAPIGKWCRAGNNRDIIYSSAIPSGYFDITPAVEKPRMIRLGGYGGNQQAFSFATELTRGTTYQYDIDYRACGGVDALYKPQFSNTSTGFESLDYYNNSFTVSTSDTGTHYSIRFTMPNNAKINANNFIIYLGQKWPLRRNGTVFFANASLYKVSGGNLTGSNLITNGDFHLGTPGKVTASNKDTVFSGWNQVQVMTYPGIYLMDIPEGFFTDDKNMNLENVYEFKGGDVYKPQFDFHFAASKTYRLIYDYYCDDNDTVNAYILSKDNTVTATKNSRISENKFQAVYTITTTASTKQYTDLQSANANIRFALNGNSYAKAFSISNIRIYVVEGGNLVGANLAMSLNPCLDDSYYGVELPGEEYAFSIAKNDSNCDSQKTNIGAGWVGNLDYNDASYENTYSKVIKTSGHLFDNYTPENKIKHMKNALLGGGNEYNPFNDTASRFYDPKADGKKDICDLIKLKKNLIDNVYTYNVSGEQTNGGIYGSFNKLACYGDSITQGMGYESTPEKNYPGRLKTMLGGGYTVYNCGDPGERSFTIMARQGALSLGTSKTITFEAGQSQVHIGVNSDNGFLTRKGDYIDLTSRLGNERSINNVTIEGRTYEVIMTDFTWSPRACNIYLKRSGDTSQALTIPKGATVTFNSYTKQDECDIYLIGANGVYTSGNDLVAQYKAMVDRHGSNNYLVIIPFWNSYCDAPMREAFGDHCVNFRLSAMGDGLTYEGITPTSTDNEYIARGEVPPSLLYYPNNPDVHLNAKGYDLMAHLLYEQGKSIGYW